MSVSLIEKGLRPGRCGTLAVADFHHSTAAVSADRLTIPFSTSLRVSTVLSFREFVLICATDPLLYAFCDFLSIFKSTTCLLAISARIQLVNPMLHRDRSWCHPRILPLSAIFVLVLAAQLCMFITRIPLTSTAYLPQIDRGWNRIPHDSPE
jgi:hypothetical protein